ncbi:MAG: zf-HC2 domain-containing protein [Candidatus Omnitrophota bacterium]
MNRLCPQEEVLSAYLSDALSPSQKIQVEKHLIKCRDCRVLLLDTHKIINTVDIHHLFRQILSFLKTNMFFFISFISLSLSFLFSKYFLQFLTASILFGSKWIVDIKTTKTLIMVQEALKPGEKKNPTEETIDHRDRS